MDAHVDGFVDAYFGPAELRERIGAEERVPPPALRDAAAALLQELPHADLEPDRIGWLTGQLRGVECVASRLAGEEIAWSDEVERCFGVRPRHVDEETFRASHRALDEALPGGGDLRSRYNAWVDAGNLPAEARPRVLERLTGAFRRRTARILELPGGEGVEYEMVRDEPWMAFNQYNGNLRSLVQVNEDLPISFLSLIETVAHESYPGHHTERACKEQRLTREGGRFETCVAIVAAPEALISEGIGTSALDVAVQDGGLAALLEDAGDTGFELDPVVATVVHEAELRLFEAATNAARMIHEDGMTTADAEAYLQEWALDSPERAAKTVGFVTYPGHRTYTTAYTDGRRLCRSFIEADPGNFRRLLTEQLTVADLLPEPT
jgi:hypothetical protein